MAYLAAKFHAKMLPATFYCDNPWPVLPGGIMANMACVAALKIGHPVFMFIKVEVNNSAF